MKDLYFSAIIGKILVLLGDAPHGKTFADWYLNEHAPAVSNLHSVTEYLANPVLSESDSIAAAYAGGTGTDPWGVKGVDEIKGATWEELLPIYKDANVIAAYFSTEYTIRKLLTDRPLQQKTPEIKRIGLLIKPHNKTHDEAMQYWIAEHPVKTIIHHYGMASYNQNHLDAKLVPQSPDIDGINCLLYWNLDALKFGHFSRPDSKEVIMEDCTHFRSDTYCLITDEYIMKMA